MMLLSLADTSGLGESGESSNSETDSDWKVKEVENEENLFLFSSPKLVESYRCLPPVVHG
jgi:hypothetical protein